MIFQDEKLRNISVLFFQSSEQPTLRQDLIHPAQFDYSIESLRQVDNFLLRVRDEEASQSEWAQLILRCGAYVGEVIRRNCTTVAYHWLSYEDAVAVNPSIAEFSKTIGTVFVLFHAPQTICFPLGRIEKFLNSGSEHSVFAFAEIMLNEAMAVPSPSAAEAFYQEAQERWVDAIELSLYDDKEVIRATMPLLESALNSDPNHVPSLVLLSDLMILLQAYEEVKELVERLREIEPENESHQTKQQLLEQLDPSSSDQRFDLEYWVVNKWERMSG